VLSTWQGWRPIVLNTVYRGKGLHFTGSGEKRRPPRSPNLNAFAERWIRSIKHECLSRLVLFGEASLRTHAN